MCDLIMVFCGYELSISYRMQDIPHLRFRLVTLTFQSSESSKVNYLNFVEKPMCDFIKGLLWLQTLYLAPFPRNSASKISVSDFDLL